MDAPVQTVFAFGDQFDLALIGQAVNRLARRKRGPRLAQPLPNFEQLNLELPLFSADDLLVRGFAESVEFGTSRSGIPRPEELPDGLHVGEGLPTVERTALLFAKVLYSDLALLLWSREGNAEVRREILNWVFATGYTWQAPLDFNGWRDAEPHEMGGKRRPGFHTFVGPPEPELDWVVNPRLEGKDFFYTRLRKVPFSFEACCAVEEIPADLLRESIRERLLELRHEPQQLDVAGSVAYH